MVKEKEKVLLEMVDKIGNIVAEGVIVSQDESKNDVIDT